MPGVSPKMGGRHCYMQIGLGLEGVNVIVSEITSSHFVCFSYTFPG